jgi:ankyrin repeat protein
MADPADDDELYALHAAIREGQDLEDIRSIVERDPQSLRRRSRGNLPLHEAVDNSRSPPAVVRYLLQQFPDAVRERSDNYEKNLPAHMACDEEVSPLDTARLVVEAWPEALSERNADGYLPLHLASDLDLIRYLVAKLPESISDIAGEGRTHVHLAVERGATVRVVRFFVETCPHLVRARDMHGQIPLHCISGRTRLSVVKYLVSQWQGSLHELDNAGRVPLHSALEVDFRDIRRIVTYLVDRAPESVRVRAKGGILPLHLAAQHGEYDSDFVPIQRLVNAWPQSLRETTYKGLLPVHLAAKRSRFPQVRFLVEQWPESVQEKSEEGWLVLHFTLQGYGVGVALHKQDMYETARFLMQRYPQSALDTTIEGYTPLHVAAMKGFCFGESDEEEVQMELDFFQDLVRRAPSAVRVASDALLFPFQYVIKESNLSAPVARFLAEQWPGAVRQPDESGGTAMHVAVSRFTPRLSFVQFLAEERPELLQATDRTGSTPLHSAAAQICLLPGAEQDLRWWDRERLGKHIEIVRYLVEQRPQSLADPDHRGSLPLHVAAARTVSALDLARLMADAHPEALGATDNAGSLPIHVAVAMTNPCLALVKFLAERRPEALEVADSNGAIPLHVAVSSATGSLLPLVQCLVELSPKSVRMRQKNGDGTLPLFLAAAAGAPLDVLLVLATTWPEAVYRTARPPSCLAHPSRLPPNKRRRKRCEL